MKSPQRRPQPATTPVRRRDAAPLTDVEKAVQDAVWPGFTLGRHGQDRDLLAGAMLKWRDHGSPRHDDGTVCPCPLDAAWPCICPPSCSRCERRTGMEPGGANRYRDVDG